MALMMLHVDKYLQVGYCEVTSHLIYSFTPFNSLAKALISFFTVF